jgi:uncharacterized protein YbbK (DUF523 family)
VTPARRLDDHRSKRVVFLSHCLLNENTRYTGGACRPACVREIVEGCLDRDLGMVQMPCPEEHAWGGVTKRLLLAAFGLRRTFLFHLRSILFPLFLLYTKIVYRRLAKGVARQIGDYLASGYSVAGVVGVDGSPSCGVHTTMELRRAFDRIASLNIDPATAHQMNAIVRRCQVSGRGLFIGALRRELQRQGAAGGGKGIAMAFRAHDLIAELDGKRADVRFP